MIVTAPLSFLHDLYNDDWTILFAPAPSDDVAELHSLLAGAEPHDALCLFVVALEEVTLFGLAVAGGPAFADHLARRRGIDGRIGFLSVAERHAGSLRAFVTGTAPLAGRVFAIRDVLSAASILTADAV